MNEVDHVQAAVLKDLSKMAIAGAGIIALLALLLWGLVTSAEAADHSLRMTLVGGFLVTWWGPPTGEAPVGAHVTSTPNKSDPRREEFGRGVTRCRPWS